MNEIAKLYENAGVRYMNINACKIDETGKDSRCNFYFYPDFTAEKQIGIIKWLLKSYDIGLSQLGERIDTSLDGVNCISGLGSGNTFEESLAQAINDLWQLLTEEEKEQIREILR